MSEEFNQVWNLQNEVRSHQNTLRMAFPQNTIYDYFEFKFNEHWILSHRNLFNRMLVEYYVAVLFYEAFFSKKCAISFQDELVRTIYPVWSSGGWSHLQHHEHSRLQIAVTWS